MRWLMTLSVVGMLIPVLPVGVTVADDALIASCDWATFLATVTAVQNTGGGTITFTCGPATILFEDGITIAAPNTVVIDGGDEIQLSGQEAQQLFVVEEGATLELRNIALIDGFAAEGGAVNNAGTLNVAGSTFSNNSATASAGAIASIGDLTITDSAFNANIADDGGAIVSSGNMEMTGSTLTGNIGTATFAGGLVNHGTAIVSETTFTDNSSFFAGAILNNEGATMNLSRSTLYGNNATGVGAGIYNGGDLTVTNSTLSDNTSSLGAALFNGGAGFAQLVASTVTGNSADSAALDNDQGTTIALRQSIVANQLNGTDCVGAITSNGNNLDSDGSCALAGAGDISNGDAQLGALADNGGPTLTHLPLLSSDVVDAGGNGCPATDQRGLPRPAGAACEIGSVELQGSAMTLCVNRYTGALTSPANGVCSAGTVEIQTPSPRPLAFCINPYTGEVSFTFNRICTAPRRAHIVPDNGDLLTCVSRFTGKHRWVVNHGQCNAYEIPNTIPAAL